jgi:beta-lactamase regulating signal transducer with metallopeptidase domain
MSMDLLIELGWKSALVAALCLGALAVLRRRSAGEKALVAHIGVLALVLLPAAALLLPKIELRVPEPIAEVATALTPPGSEPATTIDAPAGTEATFNWGAAAVLLYLAVAGAFLLGLAIAVARLQLVRARAELIRDPNWLAALVRAQDRAGFKHGTALLTSTELNSPVSWGLFRPVIIVDADALAQKERAEAIIAHELAHVTRLDWLRLMLGRLALALFWFNPLVWLLVRQSHQLSEEAADDVVLRSEISDCDYADLLLRAVRHANPPALLAANGVAPSRSSLSRRIAHVLDASQPRRPARFGWAVLTLLGATALNGVIASAQPLLAQGGGNAASGAGEAAAARLETLGDPHTRALAEAIRARDWSRRAPAGPTTFNQPAAVAPLKQALRDPDPQVRRIAVWGLSELRPTPRSEASASVAELLDDKDGAVRGQAARALGDFQSDGYAEQLTRLLRDPLPSVRVQAAHALGDLQNPNSRAALEAARSDPDPGVRAKVVWALRQVAEAESILRRYGTD